MMLLELPFKPLFLLALAFQTAHCCDDCYGPSTQVIHERIVRRMQPSAENATTSPRSPLEWGQINFLHTTDTHGWLEGHLKEENYGADWGDFVSFTRHMKQKAAELNVDLLLIDTGDLHDGNGLSDSTDPNGAVTNPIFESIDYDLLTIGNHELYVSEITYETFNEFASYYGDRYLTSNVQIQNPQTNEFEYIGNQYRYFSTPLGIRIMSFGVIFDFTGNSNASIVTPASEMVQQQWFLDAVNFKDPIDLFVVIGHNPVRADNRFSSFGTVFEAIRALRPDVPIQIFGGHTHVRDFTVYDQSATGLEAGRYCETLGWLSMTGINSATYFGDPVPSGVPVPCQAAVNVSAGEPSPASSQYLYSRRYLDWNRLTFAYHAEGSQDNTFDIDKGLEVTLDISYERIALNLSGLYGCAPRTYCVTCTPYGSPGNIYNLLETAMAAIIVNESRADVPRFIYMNEGGVRFDLVEGPFTIDDGFIVSPFKNPWVYIPDVPYSIASQILASLERVPPQKRSYVEDQEEYQAHFAGAGTCEDPVLDITSMSNPHDAQHGIVRRQTTLAPGYTTTDDFGTDGDDTPHLEIPVYDPPHAAQGYASFPTDGSTPPVVDVIFVNFMESVIVPILRGLGASNMSLSVLPYLDPSFTSDLLLPSYAKVAWQENMPNCPVGRGVGFSD